MQHEQSGDWSQAALCYAQLADQLDETHRAGALLSAADCLRRADRPAPAARLLRDAHDLVDGTLQHRVTVQLAAVLHSVGALSASRDLVMDVVTSSQDPLIKQVALDTLVSILLSQGDTVQARQFVAQLVAIPQQPISPAALHQATFLRMRGEYAAAREQFVHVLDVLGDDQHTAGAVAVVWSSMGEVSLFAQNPEQAQQDYQQACVHWKRAKRRSGLIRSEAGMLRAALCTPATPITGGLDAGIDFAVDRQLCLLEAHLRLIRAGARHAASMDATADVEVALRIARQTGARLLEGRARLGRRALGYTESTVDIQRCVGNDAGWLSVLAGKQPMLW